jgi:hypothetical protein
MSEVIPGDEDRDDTGGIADIDLTPPDEGRDDEGGTGADDGGPGSRNM